METLDSTDQAQEENTLGYLQPSESRYVIEQASISKQASISWFTLNHVLPKSDEASGRQT